MAFGSNIVSGKVADGGGLSGRMATLISAIEWAKNEKSADVIQMSLNFPVVACRSWRFYTYYETPDGQSDLSRYVDYMAFNHNIVFAISAGNEESTYPEDCNPDGNISAPADSYNSISVGAANYDRSQVDEYSAHAPTADGRYKIDVTAPGVNIYSTNPDYSTADHFSYFDGTSAAAPFVSGLAALLIDYSNSEGKVYNPMLIKVAIMNSAKKINDRNDNPWFHTNSEPLDEDSGAGLIDAKKAYELFMNESKVFEDYLLDGSTADYQLDLASAGNITITLVWPRHIESPSDEYVLANNLNLFLYNDSGDLIASSTSILNNVEHIYKELDTPGGYRIRVMAINITEGDFERYGLAFDYEVASTFTKDMTEGWNLMSIPLEMEE